MGEQNKRGVEAAVDEINARGGLLGQTVRVIVGDDACDSAQAVAVANKLVHDGVVFVAGHYCSHTSIAASRVYEQRGILMISPASTNPKLTNEGGDNVFRVARPRRSAGRDRLATIWLTNGPARRSPSSTTARSMERGSPTRPGSS